MQDFFLKILTQSFRIFIFEKTYFFSIFFMKISTIKQEDHLGILPQCLTSIIVALRNVRLIFSDSRPLVATYDMYGKICITYNLDCSVDLLEQVSSFKNVPRAPNSDFISNRYTDFCPSTTVP